MTATLSHEPRFQLATAGLSAVLLYHVKQQGALLILLQLLLTFGIITLLEAAGRRHDV